MFIPFMRCSLSECLSLKGYFYNKIDFEPVNAGMNFFCFSSLRLSGKRQWSPAKEEPLCRRPQKGSRAGRGTVAAGGLLRSGGRPGFMPFSHSWRLAALTSFSLRRGQGRAVIMECPRRMKHTVNERAHGVHGVFILRRGYGVVFSTGRYGCFVGRSVFCVGTGDSFHAFSRLFCAGIGSYGKRQRFCLFRRQL